MTTKIELIPDIERNLDQENADLMGTGPYADVLEKMIEDNIEKDTPLTIGLFGGWGSGKSSVVTTMSDRFSQKESVKIVIYDAWKYSGDAFRRSFILELKNQLNIEWETDLEVFYKDKNEDVSSKIKLVRHWWTIPLCFIPLLASLVWFIDPSQKVTNSAVTFLSMALSIVTFILSQAFVKYKIAVTTPKIFSPEQFKTIFDQAISNVSGEAKIFSKRWWKERCNGKSKCKKVIVVIDNVDRCDQETAKELLLNVKTFLDHEKCIVIMPVDDSAIKNHLSYIGDVESEEFLRKIFNVSIRIKGLNNVDRYDFTKDLIDKHQLAFSNEVASVISQEFAKNPRRIIQFLNNLTIEREIASEQERMGRIPKGSVTSNIDFLAKILLIQEEYSYLYDAILFDGLNLSKWENLYKEERLTKEKDSLLMFFARTAGISDPDNIKPYLLLHSNNDLACPEIEILIQAGEYKEVMSKVVNDSIDFNELLNYLHETLDTKLIIRKVSALPELKFLIWCSVQDEVNKIYSQREREISKYFNHIKYQHISDFLYSDVIKAAKHLKDQGQTNLYNTIVSFMNAEVLNVKTEFIQEFIRKFPITEDLGRIKDFINQRLSNDIDLFLTLLPDLGKANLHRGYLNSQTINKHIAALSPQRSGDDVKICNVIKTCLSVNLLPPDSHNSFLIKISNFLNSENTPKSYVFWYKQINGCLKNDDVGLELLKKLKQLFNAAFANRSEARWNNSLISLIPLLEEGYILGDSSVWGCMTKIYNLPDNLSLQANNSLKEIVKETDVNSWKFVDDVIKKTSNIKVNDEYFIVLGDMLKKAIGTPLISEKSAALTNWLNYIVLKKDISDNEKQILQIYFKEKDFIDSCRENVNFTKELFAIGKKESIKEVIDATAAIVLMDPSPDDVKYLLEKKYEDVNKIKNSIQSKISRGDNEIDWIRIVINSEEIWEVNEYGEILENKLVHLSLGNENQKIQAKDLWLKVNKSKISNAKREMIEKGISEIVEPDLEATIDDDDVE
jgi:hypothetical protein